jgi:lipopolysaccharide export LptBFGC system permease protein LptF
MRTLSPTLFWYIFKDLVKVFLLANGALAGILSFGGLLRPLTEQGLEAWQVGLLLTYFTPAMTAYSLPIAALFATTVVYGRLSADNEILACRAGGLSHLSLALPASILGLVVALVSALLLLFIVPIYTLKVERVVYSNLAKIIANDIERKHQIRLPGLNLSVFARSAYIPQGQKSDAFDQQVVLVNPTIVTFSLPYAGDPDRAKSRLQVAKDFHTATEATIHLTQRPGDEQIQLTVELENGSKFPRSLAAAQLGGVGAAQAGPFDLPSPIKENTKFMDIRELRKLHADRSKSAKIRSILDNFTRYDQQFMFLHGVRDTLNAERRVNYDAFGGNEKVTLERQGDPPAVEKGGDVLITSSSDPADAARRVRLSVQRAGQAPTMYEARDAVLNARPVADANRMDVSLELHDVLLHTIDGMTTPRKSSRFDFSVPMTRQIEALASKTFADYNVNPDLPREQLLATKFEDSQKKLLRELTVLTNDIVSESNSRVSFAISCLILTFVGAALGMMFRSGNFLSAFAISFIPALISITLIVAGQRVAGSVPIGYPKTENPIQLGLILVWSGNALNFVLASLLWWRLQRQ